MGWNGSSEMPRDVAKKSGTGVSWRGVGLAIAVLAIVGLLVWRVERPDGTVVSKDRLSDSSTGKGRLKKNRMPRKSASEAVRDAMPATLPRRNRQVKPSVSHFDMFKHLTGTDRKIAEAVQAGLDGDDFAKTVVAATRALASTNSEVRLNAVDALGWFGAQALPELIGAMEDADEDVRQSAVNHFESALQEIEKPAEQFRIAMAAFGSLKSEDQLTSLGGLVCNAATDLIDGEEDEGKKEENRLKVVQAIVDIIEGGATEQNAEAAASAYGTITGNEWMGIDEAEKYLQDPENYDPDGPAASNPAEEEGVDVQTTSADENA